VHDIQHRCELVTLTAQFEMRTGVRRTNDSRCIYDFYSDRSKTGRFFSPRYPQHYPPHVSCQFFFYALPHEKVKVTFDVVELEVTTGRSTLMLNDDVRYINLPKYTTLHLTPPTLLESLALSLTNILPSLTKLHLSPKPVTITFVNFAVSGHTSIRQLPTPLLPLSFTPNLITVILSTINSLSLNYPVSSRSKPFLLVLSLKLPSPVISLPGRLSLLGYPLWDGKMSTSQRAVMLCSWGVKAGIV